MADHPDPRPPVDPAATPPRAETADRAWLWTVGLLLVLLALPAVAFAGWCLYDGLVTYPLRQERWQAYEAAVFDARTREPRPEGPSRWQTRAQQEGWPPKPPEPTTDIDILTQFIMAGLCAVPGLILAIVGGVMLVLHHRATQAPVDPRVIG